MSRPLAELDGAASPVGESRRVEGIAGAREPSEHPRRRLHELGGGARALKNLCGPRLASSDNAWVRAGGPAAPRRPRRLGRGGAAAARLPPPVNGGHSSLSNRRAGARSESLAKTKDGQAAGWCSDHVAVAPIRDWLIAQSPNTGDAAPDRVQIGIVMVSLILVMAFYTLAERKVIGWIRRAGSERVNLLWIPARTAVRGRLQADVKEIVIPRTRTDFCSDSRRFCTDPSSPSGR